MRVHLMYPSCKIMKYDPDKHHRRSIRLKGYDYSQSGAYFITICTHDKKSLFGKIIDGNMVLNEFGKIVNDEWIKTEQIRKNVKIDEYMVMPNHLHGIIIINDDRRDTLMRVQSESFGKPVSGSISTIIRGFKSATTKQINEFRTPQMSVWQSNYYEHVIRNDDDLNDVREYIINNPLKWDLDRENPINIKMS
ncbi:MAG: REP-associated tyrosine transposase [Candidatus Poribacteria bacterium]|nr:REP-associated tyrosine transposase [Candidatus Poribacteria bacterium]